jgi:DNA repair protein RadA/Sms
VVHIERAPRTARAKHSVFLDEASGKSLARIPTGLEGLDRVLGGGLVRNSVVLLSGEKGCGKSTLVLQIIASLLAQHYNALVISGEETEAQIGDRAKRLKMAHFDGKVLHTTDLQEAVAEVEHLTGTAFDPDVIIVDSTQAFTDRTGAIPGGAGSMAQVMNVGEVFTAIAKREGRCIILIGQETKDGEAAGPQRLPHLVDVELRFKKDGKARRFLTDTKNRFGEADEVVVFDMTSHGLREIGNITEEKLELRLGSVGVIPFAATHLARPVLLGVEASAILIQDGVKTRDLDVTGYEVQRVRRVLDHLQEHCGCYILDRAIRVNVPLVLGEAVDDDELELAVAAALLSALHNRPPPKALIFGTIALSGQVFSEFRSDARLEAARAHKRLAFREAIIPARANGVTGVACKRIGHIRELDAAMWGTHLAMQRPAKADGDGTAARAA